MAKAPKIDPRNGFCSKTKIFHSLRPPVPLPPPSEPISITEYTLSLLHASTTPSTPFLIDSATDHQISYADFLNQVQSLSLSLQSHFPSLSHNDVAFIFCPPSLHVPVLYFSLLSLGIIVSPANPLSSTSELTHMLQLTKPSFVFTTSSLCHKFPETLKSINSVFVDQPQFQSMLSNTTTGSGVVGKHAGRVIIQNDTAVILYSSGTTGRVKGMELSHRCLIATLAGFYYNRYESGKDNVEDLPRQVMLFFLPMFHVYGFFGPIKAAALGETAIWLRGFDFEKVLEAVEKYKVAYMPVAPPLVVMLFKSDLVSKYDLSSLCQLLCGGAPLGKEVSEQFTSRFPHMEIVEGYGMTEVGGPISRMLGPEETKKYGSAGRLDQNREAKIVDPDSKEALAPGQRGELWIRGPAIMKGCVEDHQATAETLDSEGWLKTGDLCYFDSDGFLYIVDRLKELIKYKAYQVPPAELEHLLQSIPEIADAAAIPYPDEEAGQIPMAYIVRKPGSHITERQIMDIVAQQVAPYKKIRRVAFISSIPKSPAGKILRRELVNLAACAASAKL